MEKLRWRQQWPHPFERFANRLGPADAITNHPGINLLTSTGCQCFEELGLDELAGCVVRSEPPLGFLHDHLAVVHADPKMLEAETDPEVVAQTALALADRPRDELRDLDVALDRRDILGLDQIGSHLRHDQVAEYGKPYTRLTETREHLFDVSEEQSVGADHEHTLILEREAVGVEKICRAVKCHDRLAGARPTLNDEQTGERRTDDFILFALNRGDDVSQAAGASGLERADQRSPTLDLLARCRFLVESGEVTEELVVDIDEPAAPGREMAAPIQAHRVDPGGSVEGLGGRCSPIDHNRILFSIPDANPADVQRVAEGLVVIDTPEHQRRITDIELSQSVGDVLVDDFAFVAGLGGAARAHFDGGCQLERELARMLEALVGMIEVGLFRSYIGINGDSPIEMGAERALWG